LIAQSQTERLPDTCATAASKTLSKGDPKAPAPVVRSRTLLAASPGVLGPGEVTVMDGCSVRRRGTGAGTCRRLTVGPSHSRPTFTRGVSQLSDCLPRVQGPGLDDRCGEVEADSVAFDDAVGEEHQPVAGMGSTRLVR
jgi:hypothetical protein